MNRKQQEEQARQRLAVLQAKFNPQELQKIQQYNPVLAQSALESVQLNEAQIEPLSQ